MTPTECVMVTRLVQQVCPAQKLGEDTPQVWHPLLADLRVADAVEAVRRVGMRQPFIAPSEIRAEVRVIRGERVAHADATFTPVCDPDDLVAYRRELAEHRRRVGDGEPPRRVLNS